MGADSGHKQLVPAKIHTGLKTWLQRLVQSVIAKPSEDLSIIPSLDLSRDHKRRRVGSEAKMQHQLYCLYSIALAAKLCKIDGAVNEEEVREFFALFPDPENNKAEAGKRFFEAYHDTVDSRHFASKLAHLFPMQFPLLTELLVRLMRLAACDGPINQQEYSMIKKLAKHLGISDSVTKELLEQCLLPVSSDPYQLFGVTKRDNAETMKRAFHQLVQYYHPDRCRAAAVPDEVMSIMEEGFRRVTASFQILKKKHQLR